MDRRPVEASSPGRMRKSRTEKPTTTVTSTNIGTDAMIRTSQSVSIFSAWVEPCSGNQSIRSPMAMPMADATTPTPTIWATLRPPRSGASSGDRVSSGDIGPESYGSRPTRGNDVASRRPAPRRIRRRRGVAIAVTPSKRRPLRNAEGDMPWWRRKALANCAGWR